MSNLPPPLASVVITSHNRKEELLDAIASCFTQTVPLEILVFDDASTDGTSAAIREKFPPEQFPRLRLFRQETRAGLIVLRNRGAQLAQTNLIISIDDDAIFTTPAVVESTLREFNHPRVGAVGIPYQDIRISPQMFQRAPDNNQIYAVAAYIGTAHALRRDLFLQLGGYRESLIHQGEESDYCIRLLNAGYIVRLGASDQIHHFVSPKRDMNRMHYYGSRNSILFGCFNVPFSRLPFYLARTIAGNVVHAARIHALPIKLRAVLHGFRDGLRNHAQRRPVSVPAYRLFRRLRKGALPLAAIESRLPPLKNPSPA